jgi:hypothetical protein
MRLQTHDKQVATLLLNALCKCAVLHTDTAVGVDCIDEFIPKAERLERCFPLEVIANGKPEVGGVRCEV